LLLNNFNYFLNQYYKNEYYIKLYFVKNISKLVPPLLLIIISIFTQTLFAQVYLNVGDDFQNIIDNNPAGTEFIIKAGTHRMQMITAREGDTFEGETGPNGELLATLKGSKILTEFTPVAQAGKQYWLKQNCIGQNAPVAHGTCIDGVDCHRAEDVFVNGSPLIKVLSLSELDQVNECYIENDDVYIFFNPATDLIETSVLQFAIRGQQGEPEATKGASNITVRNLIVEQYANPAQFGAIHSGYNNQINVLRRMGHNWIIENNEVRYNHGVGIFIFSEGLMKNNYIHHNGQLGMRAAGDNVIIDGNESAYNGEWAGYKWSWEGGGSKFVYTNNLKLINNYCHNNNGPGLWTDIENIYTTVENNRCENNSGPGIFHEISYDATIRCNIATNNYWNIGNNTFEFYGGNIFISTSSNVEVYDNITISNGLLKGNGILVLCEDRGIDSYGQVRVSNNNHIYNNSITYTTTKNYSGLYVAGDCYGASGNQFNNNQYHSVNLNHSHFVWGTGANVGNLNWMQSRQQDAGSTINDDVFGLVCNDNDSCTENDVFTSGCTCEGTLIDADGNGVCDNVDGCTNYVINDFENQVIDDWYSYAFDDSYSFIELSNTPQRGAYALFDTCAVAWIDGYQQAGIRNDLNSVSKDWSAYLGLSFGFKGKNTGNKIYFELVDNKGEKFAYRFFDNTTEWKIFNLNWDDFFRRGGQSTDVPNDGMTLTDVQSIAIHIMTDGAYEHTIHQYFGLDNVKLICKEEIIDDDAMNITIHAKGDYGAELMTLQINGANVSEWKVSTDWEDYQYVHTGAINQLRVYLTNHEYVQGSIDYNLNIDYVAVAEDIIQTNAPKTYGTAVKIDDKYCSTGSDFQREKLFCKGYIQYIGAIPNNKIAVSETGLTIYPNPANNFIEFNFPDIDQIKSVHIYDVNGTSYKEQSELTGNRIPIQSFAKGIYWLQVSLQDGTKIHQKIIKN